MQRYKVEPYVVAGDVYARTSACRARRMDLVHGLGRMVLSRGNGMDSRIPRAGHDSEHRSLHSATWPGYSISFDITRPLQHSEWKIPAGSAAASLGWNWTGKALPGPANIPLVDDGIEHHILVVLG